MLQQMFLFDTVCLFKVILLLISTYRGISDTNTLVSGYQYAVIMRYNKFAYKYSFSERAVLLLAQ